MWNGRARCAIVRAGSAGGDGMRLVMCGLALVVCGVSARAQNAPPAPAAGSAPAPAPTIVLSRDDFIASGLTTVAEILHQLPQQSDAFDGVLDNLGDGARRADLRGLGADRTLVLINGRRVVPGGLGADDAVDLAAIPLAIVDRIEIQLAGASAAYGSGAMGGGGDILN